VSEWLKVMLDEIERKKVEAEQARIEEQRRSGESAGAETVAPQRKPGDRARG